MRLIIEWLDKDKTPIVREEVPAINLGGFVQIPIVPKVRTVIELPGHPTISGVMDSVANRHLRECITSIQVRILDDPPKKTCSTCAHEYPRGFNESCVGCNVKSRWELKPNLCECCAKFPHQYTLSDNDYQYKVCANCLPALVNTALSPVQFFTLIRNGHTTKEHLLHGDFYDDETGEALQPR